jgi:glycosyltransferase involved in cell wall biosynthesis
MNGPDRTETAALPVLVYIIGTYPLLTTTFIDREIELLRRWGITLRVISLRRPGGLLSPEQEVLQADVAYVLPVDVGGLVMNHMRFLVGRPVVFSKVLFGLLTRPHPSQRARLKTLLHFGEGVEVAALIRREFPDVDHIHAHFADRAATVALVAGRLLDLPYSLTAHANDIYVEPTLLAEKISGASFVATCTGYNASFLACAAAGGSDIACIYHGLDAQQYRPDQTLRRGKLRLLAVGQLKEKKGFSYLIEACQILRADGYEFSCEIVGEGPLRAELEAQVRDFSLEEAVTLRGALEHHEVIAAYREAAIFVLPCITAADGDRDGIPNVILEAMAMELPVVSTRHSGIPEAVADGETGLLVTPRDAAALAAALAGLMSDAERRRRLGREGRHRVVEAFDVETNVQQLFDRFVG